MDEDIFLDYIGKDELEKAMEILKRDTPSLGGKEMLNELITLQGRLTNHNRNQQGDILSVQDLRVERNQIRKDIVQFGSQLYHPIPKIASPPEKKNKWVVPSAIFSIAILIVLAAQMLRVSTVSFVANLNVSKVKFQTAEGQEDTQLEAAISTDWLEITPLTAVEFDTSIIQKTSYDGQSLRLVVEGGEIILQRFFSTQNVEVTCQYIGRILTLSRSENTSSKGTITAENAKVLIGLENHDQIRNVALAAKEYITWEADSSNINISFNMLKDTFYLYENILIQEIEFLHPKGGEKKDKSSIINGSITIDEQVYSLKKDILSFTNLTNTDLSIQQHGDKLNLKIEGQARKIKKESKNIEVLNPTFLEHYVSQYQNSVVITSFLYLIGLLYTIWKAWKDHK